MHPSRREVLAGTAVAAIGALAGCNRRSPEERPDLNSAAAGAWPTRHAGSRSTAVNDVGDVGTEPALQWSDIQFPQYDGAVFTADGGAFVVSLQTVSAVEPGGAVRWRDDAGYYGPPLLTRDTVVVDSNDAGLVALDRASGDRAWTSADVGPRALGAERVLGASGGDELAAATPGGDTAWTRLEGHAEHLGPVASGDGTVVAAFTYRHRSGGKQDEPRARSIVAAYDAESGAEQWQLGLPGSVERVAIRHDRVYAGTGIRGLGALLSVISLDGGRVQSRLTFDDGWVDGLAVANDRAVVAAGSTLQATDVRLDAPVWTRDLPGRATSLAASASRVYTTWSAGSDAGVVLAAFDTADGTEHWRKTLPPNWGYVAGVTDGRVFVVGSGNTGLFVLG